MPYSIPSSTKILTMATTPFLFISVGAVSVCEFAMVPRVYFLLSRQEKEFALFFLRAEMYTFSTTSTQCVLAVWRLKQPLIFSCIAITIILSDLHCLMSFAKLISTYQIFLKRSFRISFYMEALFLVITKTSLS